MGKEHRERLAQVAREPERYAQTIRYLSSHMKAFLRPQERVLLCFSDAPGSMGAMLAQVVRELGAEPLFWGPDHSWQALLRQTFFSRPGTLIGQPLIVLGLTKVARATATPLTIRNVLLAGAPSEEWMIDGIQHGLDATIWGCYDPIPGAVVGGFSCTASRGVHIREDVLTVHIMGADGKAVPEGELGEIVISHADDPSVCYATGEAGRVTTQPCKCGCTDARLFDMCSLMDSDPALDGLQEHLLSWTSVLDYRAERTEMGLELEVVAFPGQRLPAIPSCAKRHVRPWMPKHDVPFCIK